MFITTVADNNTAFSRAIHILSGNTLVEPTSTDFNNGSTTTAPGEYVCVNVIRKCQLVA